MKDQAPKSVWITEERKGYPKYEVTEQDGTTAHYSVQTLPWYIWDCMVENRCPVYYGPAKEQIWLEEA